MSNTADTQAETTSPPGVDTAQDQRHDLIVGVRFELSPRKPFAHVYPAHTRVQTVLDASMHHFGVQPDPNTAYYLTAHRERQPADRTLAEVAGHRDEIEFRMVKELIQGGA